MIVGLLVFVFAASFFNPYSPTLVTGPLNSPPTLAHPFGTDYIGRDVMSQLAWGAYPSLLVSFSAAIIASMIGFFVGLYSGYYRRLGIVLGAATDIVLTLPNIVVLLIIGSLFQPTDELLIGALSLFLWPSVARGVRAQTQSLVSRPYVDAAKSSGMSDRQIIMRTLAPKVGGVAMAYFILNVALSIVIVTALEFLGLGNPAVPSWGSMLFFAQSYGIYVGDWWWMLAPGLAITIFATGFALVGFTIEEIMNPRLRMK
jgi:peptide/nickel transport system permease protein